MKMKSKKSSVIALSLAIPALVFGSVTSAQAATTEEVSQTIVESSLASLEIEITDETLLAELESDIETALTEEVIDPAIVDTAETIIDETAGETVTETPAPTPTDLEELIDENLTEETDVWEEQAPAWLAAFEQLRAEFEVCRTDGQSTSDCARTFGFQLQLAHAEGKLAEIDAAIANISALPAEEQAAALAELEAQRSAFQAKLERTAERLAAAVATGNAGATTQIQERLNSVISEVRVRANAPELPQQAQQNAPGNSGGQNNSSQNNPGQSNAPVTPQSGQQSSGSVRVDVAPGNSGNAGKPANPGNQGKGNSQNNR